MIGFIFGWRFSVVSFNSSVSSESFRSLSSTLWRRSSFSTYCTCNASVSSFCMLWIASNCKLWEFSTDIKCSTSYMILSFSFFLPNRIGVYFVTFCFVLSDSSLEDLLSSDSDSVWDFCFFYFVFTRLGWGVSTSKVGCGTRLEPFNDVSYLTSRSSVSTLLIRSRCSTICFLRLVLNF